MKALKVEEACKPLADEFEISTDQAHMLDLYLIYWVYVHWPQHFSTLTAHDRKELDTLIRSFYSLSPIPDFLARTPYRETMDWEILEYVEQIIAKRADVDLRESN